ncbi:MAG TPA: 2-amino-4-hydroxy-6-hydroxymethyldihydropteridine diphosphokinase [Vicinamibacterales bacterium]|nr:2-amino-4-hydroxy-6-hydroxymethyldihydropteridine diphosphokinase [Vicinamibacterales bacterium]
MTPVAIALGSNLGDREQHLRDALTALAPIVHNLRVSTFHETAPVGVPGPQPMFLNAAAVGETTLSANALLEQLLAIEASLGRVRPYPNAPRTVDLDLILYDAAIEDSARLTLPHPRFRERRFVLEPLAEIAPDWRDPVTGKSVEELLRVLVV